MSHLWGFCLSAGNSLWGRPATGILGLWQIQWKLSYRSLIKEKVGARDLNQVSESRDVQVHLYVHKYSCNQHEVMLLCYVATAYGAICVTHIQMKHKLHIASGSAPSPPNPKFRVCACTLPLCTRTCSTLSVHTAVTCPDWYQPVFCLLSSYRCPRRPYWETQRACGAGGRGCLISARGGWCQGVSGEAPCNQASRSSSGTCWETCWQVCVCVVTPCSLV